MINIQYHLSRKIYIFKYNKRFYFWFHNGYLYFPNVEWDAAKIEAIFEGDTGDFQCDPEDQCIIKQDLPLPLPEYLFSEIEQYVIKDFTTTVQLPTDGADDSKNVLR